MATFGGLGAPGFWRSSDWTVRRTRHGDEPLYWYRRLFLRRTLTNSEALELTASPRHRRARVFFSVPSASVLKIALAFARYLACSALIFQRM